MRAPVDYPSGKAGDVLTVEFTVCGISCIGLNGGDSFKHSEAFSFQIGTLSSATAAPRASVAGAKINGACRGRLVRAC